MQELDKDTVESSELVEQTFKFWFEGSEHIRSPFPVYIRSRLKSLATEKFYEWVENINPEAKDDLNETAIGEKFEEIIFETATSLIQTEDERITILYPFLPRIGDPITNANHEESTVTDRSIQKKEDHNFLIVTCRQTGTGEIWKTSFELPI